MKTVLSRLEENERQEMLSTLKVKWAAVNAAYQRLPFAADSDSSKQRKERFFPSFLSHFSSLEPFRFE